MLTDRWAHLQPRRCACVDTCVCLPWPPPDPESGIGRYDPHGDWVVGAWGSWRFVLHPGPPDPAARPYSEETR